ncbi:MAG: tetratricopeptide repeat protein [Planctomycetaceae bacterium]
MEKFYQTERLTEVICLKSRLFWTRSTTFFDQERNAMEPMRFKFKYLNEQGQETGFFSRKGHFDGHTLVLDTTEIPASDIYEVDHRGNRMVLVEARDEQHPTTIVFAVNSGSVPDLKQALGVARSAAAAARRKQQLTEQGLGNTFHEVVCPHCSATNDLTGFRDSPQISCQFCHAVATVAGAPEEEKHYRLCDECGMYSKPRQFTVFYFYFLLVVYGWSSRQTWRCPGCMRGEAWKMLFGNLIFVLGVPVAIIQLIRAYGGTDLSSMYKGLDGANLKARSGRMEAAIVDYRRILERQPESAGVKYNIGLAFAQQNELQAAAKTLEAALNDCANYQPAANLLAHCYAQLGEDEKLADLRAEWGAEGDDVQEDTVDLLEEEQ